MMGLLWVEGRAVWLLSFACHWSVGGTSASFPPPHDLISLLSAM